MGHSETIVEALHPDYTQNIETGHEEGEEAQAHHRADVELVEEEPKALVQWAQIYLLTEELIPPEYPHNSIDLHNTINYPEQPNEPRHLPHRDTDILIITQQHKRHKQQRHIQPIPPII